MSVRSRRSYPNDTLLPAVAGLTLALCGCASDRYEARPLEPERVVRHLVEERAAIADRDRSGEPLTLALAARWLRERGPAVREAIAEYRARRAVAAVETPLPNPSLELGPEWGFGDDVTSRELQAKGGLGWSIPLGDRRAAEDARNAALAEQARVDALATYREQYLELRVRYAALVTARARLDMRADLVESTAAAVRTALELVDAGEATAIDVSLFRLEHARERSRLLAARRAASEAESDLAALVAVDAATLGALPTEVAVPPTETPGLALLRDGLAAHHPELQRLRAAYDVAERQLALELARQVPDLALGVAGGGETGERKSVLSLGLGIDLLVFDRNQQAIAAADARRERARTAFEAGVERALSALERAHRALDPIAAHRRMLDDEVLPAARENVRIARQSLGAGFADAVQVLDAQRSLAQVRLELLEASLEELTGWADLERATGRPWLEYPSDPGAAGALPPAELAPTPPAAPTSDDEPYDDQF